MECKGASAEHTACQLRTHPTPLFSIFPSALSVPYTVTLTPTDPRKILGPLALIYTPRLASLHMRIANPGHPCHECEHVV